MMFNLHSLISYFKRKETNGQSFTLKTLRKKYIFLIEKVVFIIGLIIDLEQIQDCTVWFFGGGWGEGVLYLYVKLETLADDPEARVDVLRT